MGIGLGIDQVWQMQRVAVLSLSGTVLAVSSVRRVP
jgi:hypothetical protein